MEDGIVMKKFKSKLTVALFTMTAFVFGLTGCGANFDAKTYVKGSLDAIFKHEISDDLAKLTEGGKEEIEEDYDEAFEGIVDAFKAEGCPDSLLESYKTTMQDIFSKAKYTVGEETKDDDGNYVVSVTSEAIIVDAETFIEEASLMGAIMTN